MDPTTVEMLKSLLAAPTTNFVFGVAASVLAAPIWVLLSGGFDYFRSDLPRLKHKWQLEYFEPDDKGEHSASVEILELKQFGTRIWGTATKVGDDQSVFKYKGRIKRRSIIITYRLAGHTSITFGNGALHALIDDDDSAFKGWCVWHDQDTKQIESSPITGRKVA